MTSLYLIGAALLFTLFGAGWILHLKIRDMSLVDLLWTFSFLPVGALYFGGSPGWMPRKALLFSLLSLWSLRLGRHLVQRFLKTHPNEDKRYAKLRASWKTQKRSHALASFGMFQFQALLVWILSAPFLFVFQNSEPHLSLFEGIALPLFILSILGESTADRQLTKFKSQEQNRFKVCDVGLWGYSRHPNYFFEFCIWLSFAIFCYGSPGGWMGSISAGLMLLLLTKVTGVPLAEEQSLLSRGDAYRSYQERVSIFVPWFPKTK